MLFGRDANAGRSGFFKAGKHAKAQTKKSRAWRDPDAASA
jgi:hypothetical protein